MPEKVRTAGQSWWFWCPGCQTNHRFTADRWQKSGTNEAPTFTPSLISDYGDGRKCHLIITDGKIHYLGDSYHDLKNQVVPMEEFDADFSTGG
jgi:Family of unknown function (DUF6527)